VDERNHTNPRQCDRSQADSQAHSSRNEHPARAIGLMSLYERGTAKLFEFQPNINADLARRRDLLAA
jgi:hypothetical protein